MRIGVLPTGEAHHGDELSRTRSAALISPLDPRAPTDLFGQAHIFNDRSPGQQSSNPSHPPCRGAAELMP